MCFFAFGRSASIWLFRESATSLNINQITKRLNQNRARLALPILRIDLSRQVNIDIGKPILTPPPPGPWRGPGDPVQGSAEPVSIAAMKFMNAGSQQGNSQ